MVDSYSREQLQEVMESAKRMKVELDEAEAIAWLDAIHKAGDSREIVFDERSGVFGQNIAMLDFSSERLEYFRAIGGLVEFLDIPGKVETALALSGSSAQSKIQRYPGDCDYFERVNIIAPTKEEACQILAEIMKKKALDFRQGPTYQLIEVKLGSYPAPFVKGKATFAAGSPISWRPDEIEDGKKVGFTEDGKPFEILWEDAAQNPGWCKLDWVVADPIRGSLANASNMLDVTWEAPDGTIIPLDGYLDPYFQEVYLQAESVPIFSKLAQHVSADALEDYVKALEGEVRKYVTKHINYGKAAKRMYNIFRLTGRYEEAVFLRELFDEPTSMLYQVWSLIRTVDDAVQVKAAFKQEQLLKQAEDLMLEVIRVMEDAREAEIVSRILRFRDAIKNQDNYAELSTQAEAAREELINVVNNFFYDRLVAVPEIKNYMEQFHLDENEG
ncbi:hypothetical protein JR338_00845 [Chloroflexota bacterium]|nr:hypothetical protein JR338_00845 [Chloroflexota bacterium]